MFSSISSFSGRFAAGKIRRILRESIPSQFPQFGSGSAITLYANTSEGVTYNYTTKTMTISASALPGGWSTVDNSNGFYGSADSNTDVLALSGATAQTISIVLPSSLTVPTVSNSTFEFSLSPSISNNSFAHPLSIREESSDKMIGYVVPNSSSFGSIGGWRQWYGNETGSGDTNGNGVTDSQFPGHMVPGRFAYQAFEMSPYVGSPIANNARIELYSTVDDNSTEVFWFRSASQNFLERGLPEVKYDTLDIGRTKVNTSNNYTYPYNRVYQAYYDQIRVSSNTRYPDTFFEDYSSLLPDGPFVYDANTELIINFGPNLSANVVLDLDAYWYSGSGNLLDNTRNDNDAIANGTPTFVSGSGTYFDFTGGFTTGPGTNDSFRVIDDSSIDTMNEISFEMWLNIDTVQGSGSPNLLFHKRSTSSNGYVAFFTNTAYTFRVGTTSPSQFTYTTTPTTGSWQHIIVTIGGSGTKMYINNTEVANSAYVGNFSNINTGATLTIGDVGNLTGLGMPYVETPGETIYSLDGKIGLFRIYNGNLSADDVEIRYNATKGRFGL